MAEDSLERARFTGQFRAGAPPTGSLFIYLFIYLLNRASFSLFQEEHFEPIEQTFSNPS